ncbi:pyridoxamine 5'-phosphate oxidase [Simiduia litorea]|uniref:pyridoxamine 5'-phosphate oxidase n=1 Tax=Simiduia litorea TaxID=1435348 RepID=UPI0036F359EA
MNLEDLRRDYLMAGLDEKDLAANPIAQFEIWLKQAIELQLKDPTAMTVATVDASGQPSQRIVLLKHVDAAGFVFFTNYGSRKARELAGNQKISLHFPWHDIERQVKVCGVAEKISAVESAKYFLSRPKESQLAAWASHQSHPVSTRQMLMQQVARMKEKFAHGDIPAPDFWGGFRVAPHEIEFWQGGANRLHDRFSYRRTGEQWAIDRLAP